MSTSSGQQKWDGSIFNIETVAVQLIALVDEFEAAIGEGRVPAACAERLATLREGAEGLIPT